MKHAFPFLLVCCGLLFLRGRPLLGEDQQFPATPYQGMQLTYDLSGVSVSHAKDSADVTRTRTLSGELQGNELRVDRSMSASRSDKAADHGLGR